MKIAVLSMLSVLVVLFSFQNCQKPPHADEINAGLSQPNNSSSSKVDLNQEKVDSVNFMVEAQKPVTRGGHTITINYNKVLQVDLETGVIVVTSDLDSQTEKYCLTEQLRTELVSILKSSQVCKSEGRAQPGVACAQVMRPAYAQLITDREQFELGSATDGCGSNSQDLCGDQATLLKGYISNVKKQYADLSCPQ